MKSIIIADDYPLTLSGTRHFVEQLGYTVLAVCSNGSSALNSIRLHRPDMALIDVNMPGLDGLDVLEELAGKRFPTRVILLTMHNEYAIYNRAKELGAYGYVLKERSNIELKECLQTVAEGRQWFSTSITDQGGNIENQASGSNELTLVERKVIELIRENRSSKQIADMLFLSEKTVEKHRSRIIEKLGLPKEKNALLKWLMSQTK